jgi:hypothetical protein
MKHRNRKSRRNLDIKPPSSVQPSVVEERRSVNKPAGTPITDQLAFWSFLYQKTDKLKDLMYMRASIVLATFVFLVPFQVDLISKFTFSRNDRLATCDGVFLFCFVLAFVCDGLSFLYSILTVQPFDWISRLRAQLKGRTSKETTKHTENPFIMAFPYVVKMDYEEFERTFRGVSDDEIARQMASGLFNLSHIVSNRYEKLMRAYTYLIVSVFTTGIIISLQVFQKTILPWITR